MVVEMIEALNLDIQWIGREMIESICTEVVQRRLS